MREKQSKYEIDVLLLDCIDEVIARITVPFTSEIKAYEYHGSIEEWISVSDYQTKKIKAVLWYKDMAVLKKEWKVNNDD